MTHHHVCHASKGTQLCLALTLTPLALPLQVCTGGDPHSSQWEGGRPSGVSACLPACFSCRRAWRHCHACSNRAGQAGGRAGGAGGTLTPH